MHGGHGNTLSVMAGLFGKIPSDDPHFFTIRRLEMRGRKVEISSPPIGSPIHCFFYLTEGEAMISVGKDLYFFRPGECCVIPAGQVFSIRYFDDCTGYMGGFNSDLLCGSGENPLQAYAPLRRWGDHKVAFPDAIRSEIDGIFRRLCAENEAARNPKIIQAYLSALLAEIEAAGNGSGDAVSGSDNAVCNRYIEIVFENFHLNHSLGDYAAQINISEERLRRIVKRHTGKSPVEWINEARILEAKSLLFNTDLTVSEISMRVGVEDPAYFSRLFKKSTSMTPIQYRTARKISNTSTE